MTNPRFLVSIVDDDESVRESPPGLLKVFGFGSQTFSPAEEFLAKDGTSRSNCLVLDVAMPGMGGPELQKESIEKRAERCARHSLAPWPSVVVSNVSVAVKARRYGHKPKRGQFAYGKRYPLYPATD